MDSSKLSVSIVIPNYNGRKLLEKHLPDVMAACGDHEVIVVDDASTDDSLEFIHSNYPKIKTFSLDENQRYAGAVNAGVEAAAGDIVILLNNDVSPERNFLEPLIKPFLDPDVFAVGCREMTSPGDEMPQGKSCGEFQRGLVIHRRCDDQSRGKSLWAFGGSGAFRRSLWNELGGMDTMFSPAYEEDRDLSYRAWKRGYLVLHEPKSVVYHHHETTHESVLGTDSIQVSSFKNSMLFVWKNITHKPYILQHFLWLPYHMIVTSLRTRGLFLKGFVGAIGQFTRAMNERKIEISEEKVHDPKILAQFAAK